MVVAAGGAGGAGQGPRGREAPRGAAGLVNAADTCTGASSGTNMKRKNLMLGCRAAEKVCVKKSFVTEYGRFLC